MAGELELPNLLDYGLPTTNLENSLHNVLFFYMMLSRLLHEKSKSVKPSERMVYCAHCPDGSKPMQYKNLVRHTKRTHPEKPPRERGSTTLSSFLQKTNKKPKVQFSNTNYIGNVVFELTNDTTPEQPPSQELEPTVLSSSRNVL